MKFGAVENKARLAIVMFVLALLLTIALSVALYSQLGSQIASSPIIIYIFSYQIVALILGLGLVFLLVRWLLRPYRRMVEAARGSPVGPSSAISESEFVAETFQALIDQLQAKERELEQLHARERRRAEKSERFSERVIANIPSGLVAIDSSGLVTSVNAQALKIFVAVEARGHNIADSLEAGLQTLAVDYHAFFESSPRMVEMISECLTRGDTFRRGEVDVIHADGRVRHLGLSISPMLDSSTNIEGALCLFTDLTEVIEMRERMKLQESMANLGEMAAGLAHEFKNSLATISGFIQLLQAQFESPAPTDDPQATLTLTLNEVRLLARLVTDFLNFARPQHLNLARISLSSIISECSDEVRPQLVGSGIGLKVEGEFPDLAGDESMLRRVFVNLIRNGAEAIDPQSEEKLVVIKGTIDSGNGKRYAHVRVCDTGTGIAATDLHRIFIPFFTTKSRGYGIGLAIVQKIIVAHGGDVTVEKSDARGTVFHCRLPLALPSLDVEPQ